jgi:predicted TIM-barrel fold metal-dependent hydrolase
MGRMITDIHVHVQPVRMLKNEVREAILTEGDERFARIEAVGRDPSLLLAEMDRCGIGRVGLVNDISPDVTGFTEESNQACARYASHDRKRLLVIGGIHARRVTDPEGTVDRMADLGMVCLKIHPPHQGYPANAYTQGLGALARIYRRAEERGIPVMIHTGTSLFPGARCKYGKPMELDDVAVDFPGLTLIMAHGGRPLWCDEAFFVLRRHRHVWLDLSGIPPKRLLHYFPRLADVADRALWGSDWPSPGVKDLRTNLDDFLSLPLADDLKKRITEENALRVFPV